MNRMRKEDMKARNVRLKINTHRRLEKYLSELIGQKGTKLVFDDAINTLLDEHYKERKHEKD